MRNDKLRSYGWVAWTLVLLLVSVTTGYAAEGEFQVVCPTNPVVIGTSFIAEIRFDAGTRVPAALGFNFNFPKAAVAITAVEGGNTAEFAAAPQTDPSSFTSGSTLVTAVNSTSTTSPTGTINIARIRLTTQGATPGSINLQAEPMVALDVGGQTYTTVLGACSMNLVAGPTPTPTATPRPPVACVGDCDASTDVTVDELLTGIAIALGARPAGDCPPFDEDGDGQVIVTEIVTAVNASLMGCPAPPATATPSATPTATASSTPIPNEAPQVLPANVYIGSPGAEIRYPIKATDPDGDALQFLADSLPEGASLDLATGIFSWIPTADQVGPFYVPFRVVDDAAAPASAEGMLRLQIEPLSPCTDVSCNSATGCTFTLKSLSENCCGGEEPPRIPYVDAGCPEGPVLFAGRNTSGGIGRVAQCSWLRVLNFAQAGAAVRLNFEARCLSPFTGIRVRMRMQTKDRLMIDDDIGLTFFEGDNGYIERVTVPFDVRGGGPFFDLDFAEANMTVIATDGTGATVRTDRRVRLTFEPVPDLVDPVAPAP